MRKRFRANPVELLEVRVLLSAAAQAALTPMHASSDGSISGIAFLDANRDGYRGSEDRGIGGLTIFLDSNHNGKLDPHELSRTTNDSGDYSFAGLRPGLYRVAELPDPDYGQISPAGEVLVRLQPGQAVSAVNFGNQPLSEDALPLSNEQEEDSHTSTFTAPDPVDQGVGDPAASQNSLAVSAGTWTSIGPAPISNGQTPGKNPVSGRVVAIAADPANANVIYLAAASGGIWKTIDGGGSWTPLTDNQATLVMGSITLAPSNDNIIYAGTGEPNNSGDSYYGRGVLKSTDGGTTWSLMGNSTFFRKAIGKVIVSPTDPNTVYAMVANSGVNGLGGGLGVYKSTNGGTTWSNTTASIETTTNYTDLVMDPSNPQVLYCALGKGGVGSANNGVYETTDGGTTWVKLTNFPVGGTTTGRISVAIAPGNSQVLYASASDPSTSGLLGVFKSIDGGATWTTISPAFNYMGGQGDYDQTIAVDPGNADIVYVGGQGDATRAIMQSTDGGATWNGVALGASGSDGPHGDHHAATFDANGNYLDGNDGGIWKLDNSDLSSLHWTDLNANLAITQFVAVGVAANDSGIVFGGTQDNGTDESNSGTTVWTQRLGGDGARAIISPNNPYRVYSVAPVGSASPTTFFRRSDDGGSSWNSRVTGIGTGDGGIFNRPFTIDPNSYGGYDRLVLGTDRVYESTNSGDTWTPISTINAAGWTTNAGINTVALAASDVNTIYASAGGSTFVTTNRGASWTKVNITGATDHVSQIIVDPTNSQVAYAVRDRFGGSKVFRTTNGGLTWTSITGNLPDIPVYSIVLQPNGAGTGDDVLYVGSDIGVFTSSNLGATWTQLGVGLPTVSVHDLELNQQNVLVAATYGRSVWEIQIGPPTGNVIALQDGSEIHISWTSNAGASSSFDIQRSTDGGSFAHLTSVASTQLSYIDAAVVPGHTYTYQIIASGQSAAPADLSNPLSFQRTGDVNFTSGFTSSARLTFNEATVSNNQLQLTDGANSESRSAFLSLGNGNITNFSTQFDFQFTNPGADGFTFTLQSIAPNTGGRDGGSFGFGGINNSVAIFFNMYQNVSQTGLFTDGDTSGTRLSIPGNPFHTTNSSGQTDVFHVLLQYNSSTQNLSETITDTGNSSTFSTSYSLDLASVIQDQNAYAGFTAGTGGLNSTQNILNWWWSPVGDPITAIVNGTPGSDNLTLRLHADGQHLDVTNNGVSQPQVLLTNASSLQINGLGGSDVITIDESGGDFLFAGSNTNTVTDDGTLTLGLIGTSASESADIGGGSEVLFFNRKSVQFTGSTGALQSLAYSDAGGNDTVLVAGAIPITVNTTSGNDIINFEGFGTIYPSTGLVTINNAASGGGSELLSVHASPTLSLNVASGTTTIAAYLGTGIRQLNVSNITIGTAGKLVIAQSSSTNNDYSKHGNRTVLNISSGGLSVASGGTLDMGDNDLILHFAPANQAAANSMIRGLLTSGFDGASWDTPGINSSTASYDANFGAGTRALGYADNNDLGYSTFDGVDTSDGNEVLVKFTYYGDSDLNGQINGTDFSLFGAGRSGAGAGWDFGDYDYTGGRPNGTDFSLFGAGLSSYRQFGAL